MLNKDENDTFDHRRDVLGIQGLFCKTCPNEKYSLEKLYALLNNHRDAIQTNIESPTWKMRSIFQLVLERVESHLDDTWRRITLRSWTEEEIGNYGLQWKSLLEKLANQTRAKKIRGLLALAETQKRTGYPTHPLGIDGLALDQFLTVEQIIYIIEWYHAKEALVLFLQKSKGLELLPEDIAALTRTLQPRSTTTLEVITNVSWWFKGQDWLLRDLTFNITWAAIQTGMHIYAGGLNSFVAMLKDPAVFMSANKTTFMLFGAPMFRVLVGIMKFFTENILVKSLGYLANNPIVNLFKGRIPLLLSLLGLSQFSSLAEAISSEGLGWIPWTILSAVQVFINIFSNVTSWTMLGSSTLDYVKGVGWLSMFTQALGGASTLAFAVPFIPKAAALAGPWGAVGLAVLGVGLSVWSVISELQLEKMIKYDWIGDMIKWKTSVFANFMLGSGMLVFSGLFGGSMALGSTVGSLGLMNILGVGAFLSVRYPKFLCRLGLFIATKANRRLINLQGQGAVSATIGLVASGAQTLNIMRVWGQLTFEFRKFQDLRCDWLDEKFGGLVNEVTKWRLVYKIAALSIRMLAYTAYGPLGAAAGPAVSGVAWGYVDLFLAYAPADPSDQIIALLKDDKAFLPEFHTATDTLLRATLDGKKKDQANEELSAREQAKKKKEEEYRKKCYEEGKMCMFQYFF